MVLHLKALSKIGKDRIFTAYIHELETAFNLSSQIVAQGDTLLEASLLEEGKQTFLLPLAAFDGQPFSQPLQSLEQQWRLALNDSEASATIHPELINWALHRVDSYEKSINNQSILIGRFEILLERAQKRLFDEPNRSRLITHYQACISHYEHQATYFQHQRQHMALRLNQLLTL